MAHPEVIAFAPRYARNYDPSDILQGMISRIEWENLCTFGRSARGAIHSTSKTKQREGHLMELVRRLWCEQEGQDIAEYAVMLAVILVIVVGTVRLIGSNANNVFSQVASSIQ